MIKSLRYLLIITLSISVFSCKKETQSTASLKDALVGKWFYTSYTEKEYDKNGKLTKSTNLPIRVNADYMRFTADDKFTAVQQQQDEDTKKFIIVEFGGTYKINSLTKFTLTVDVDGTNKIPATCTLKSLNASELIFTIQDPAKVTGQPYMVIEQKLHR